MTRLAPLTPLLIVGLGCGTRPSSATLTGALPFHTGLYSLEFFGAPKRSATALADRRSERARGISRLSPRGLVAADVMLRHDDATWQGVPASDADGTFDLQLTAGDGALRGLNTWTTGPVVTGTMRGVMKSTTMLGAAEKLGEYQVTLAGEDGAPNARINGNVSLDGVITHGVVFGTVVFKNNAGVSVPCASGTVAWILSLEGSISSGVQ